MDKVALVNFDIETGERLIDALDRDGKASKVALWAKLPEYEDWRLVIASDRIAQTGTLHPYTQLNAAMEKAGISISMRPNVFSMAKGQSVYSIAAKPVFEGSGHLRYAPGRTEIRRSVHRRRVRVPHPLEFESRCKRSLPLPPATDDSIFNGRSQHAWLVRAL